MSEPMSGAHNKGLVHRYGQEFGRLDVSEPEPLPDIEEPSNLLPAVGWAVLFLAALIALAGLAIWAAVSA